MSSLSNIEEHLEKQPVNKQGVDNLEEKPENAKPNEVNFPKTMEADKNTELENSTTMADLPLAAGRHRKLPAELNCQIFYCLNSTSRRKFILGLGWNFYAMFRQILLKKSKRLCNPAKGNRWKGRNNRNVKISEDGLNASNITSTYGAILYAKEGFPISGEHCRKDNFPGTVCYYYEVKMLNSASWCFVGLTDGKFLPGGWIGRSPNSYAIVLPPIPNHNFYQFRLVGQRHDFEFPDGVIRPEVKETGNVAGCGILMNSDDKMTIFFTFNGILIDRQFQIDPKVDHLVPTVSLFGDMSLEANFGDNPAKPFEYDIKKCPGMGLEWV